MSSNAVCAPHQKRFREQPKRFLKAVHPLTLWRIQDENVNEQFVEIAKTNVETMVDLGNASFSGVEKFVELQLKVAKGAMGQSADNLKALVSVKDVQDFVKVQSSFALPTMESAVGYANAVYGIMSETVNTYAKMAEAQIAAGNEKITTAVEEFSRALPPVPRAVLLWSSQP